MHTTLTDGTHNSVKKRDVVECNMLGLDLPFKGWVSHRT